MENSDYRFNINDINIFFLGYTCDFMFNLIIILKKYCICKSREVSIIPSVKAYNYLGKIISSHKKYFSEKHEQLKMGKKLASLL